MNSNTAPKRGISQQSFSPTLPYSTTPAERVPLLQVFELALSRGMAWLAGNRPPCLPVGHKQQLNTDDGLLAAECGVYLGHSLAACGQLARSANAPITFIGLDTFSGLPTLSSNDRNLAPQTAPYLTTQFFADTSLESVKRRLADAGVESIVRLVPGLFRDGLPTLPEANYFFVNIDCDLYEPHLECLEYFYPRVPSGGIIYFDDYHSRDFPMARKAIDEFMARRPEQLFHLRYGSDAVNHTKAFIVKC